MKTITQYKDDIANLMKKIGEIDARATLENRDTNMEEVALKNEMLDIISETDKTVKTLERQERVQTMLNEVPRAATLQPSAHIDATDSRSRDRFTNFGQQLVAIMDAGRPGGRVDPRLFNVAAKELTESVPSDGGFLVQTDFSNELLQQVYQTGILAPKCRRIQISGNANGIKMNGVDETSRAATRSGGVLAYWKGEADEKTKSKPKFRQIELSLRKLIGLCYATDELLADASALEGFIKMAFAAEFGFQVDNAIINGTGAGQPLGILNAGCLVSVGKEAGQGKTVIWENVVNMYARLFATSRANAAWYINQAVEPQLMNMKMDVGTGGVPVYLPAGGASVSPYATLFGRPVIPIEQAAALGDQGDIIFGDFAGGYMLAEKGGIQSDMSIHVQFVYDESVFRFVMRLDGQPVRASALTPFKGSDTLSHFVVLDAR